MFFSPCRFDANRNGLSVLTVLICLLAAIGVVQAGDIERASDRGVRTASAGWLADDDAGNMLLAALAEPERVDLSLAIAPDDRREVYDGEFIFFSLSLEREGYVYLFYLDTEGNLLQMLPNAEMSNHWFPAGSDMPFPSLEEPMSYVIVPPFGDELLLVFVSDNAQIDLPGEWRETGVRELDIDLDRVEELIFDASSTLFGRADLAFVSRPVGN
ncbi:MAG: DUF4384 domain-containing protein [Gammaproteobacteria bacterium]|nr:DUF4384 domain-containing protein [Gammaproteobacteria bacterium]